MKAYCQWIVRSCTYVISAQLIIVMGGGGGVLSAQDLLTGHISKAKTTQGASLKSVKPSAQLELFTLNKKSLNKSAYNDLEYLSFNVTRDVITIIKDQQHTTLDIAIPVLSNKTISITLTQHEVLTSDYILTTSSGIQNKKTRSPLFYRGSLIEDPNSSVTLTVFDHTLRMLITDHNGTYEINQSATNEAEYLMYNVKNLDKQKDFTCFTDDYFNLSGDNNLSEDQSKGTYKSSSSCIPIYVETDLATLQHFNNSIIDVENYIVALVSEVATLYDREGIQISLSQIHIATDAADDFSSGFSFARSVIDEFGKKVKDNYQGRLAHFITHRNLLGGIGWIDVLCSNHTTFQADWDNDGVPETHHYGPYAVSSGIGEDLSSFPTYSWDVNVFAHELGHNLGSPHTHACAWGANDLAIDDCQSTEGGCGLMDSPTPPAELGTIMSYCHLTSVGVDLNKGFGTLPGDLIRQKYQNSSCTLSCSAVEGCTDASFHNYNPDATVNDGSCEETCDDLIKNGDETGIDCGGSLCPSCEVACEENYLKLMIAFDGVPSETSWILLDSLTGDTIDYGGPYPQSMAYDSIVTEYCLEDATYTLVIRDVFGDGICCSQGNGEYMVTSANSVIEAQGASFGSTAIHHIKFNTSSCMPSLNLNNQNLSGDYRANDMIMTSNSQASSPSVMFGASEIIINSDFTVAQGSNVEIYNEGCN